MAVLNSTAAIRKWRAAHPNDRLILRGADLRGANLREADLDGADLRWANLLGADLREADLREAYLRGAYLRWADLRRADLRGANLREADLLGAYLRWANLDGADLREADLGNNRILQIGPIGSRRDYLILKAGPELDEVSTGCFTGTLGEFELAVNQTHPDNRWGEEYRLVIAMFKATLAQTASR